VSDGSGSWFERRSRSDPSPSAISAKVHRPDLALYEPLQERHVLVASESVPQRFERGVDNLAAAVIAEAAPLRRSQ